MWRRKKIYAKLVQCFLTGFSKQYSQRDSCDLFYIEQIFQEEYLIVKTWTISTTTLILQNANNMFDNISSPSHTSQWSFRSFCWYYRCVVNATYWKFRSPIDEIMFLVMYSLRVMAEFICWWDNVLGDVLVTGDGWVRQLMR